ncbi:MAG: hypothetical protein QG565_1305 [Campylobacterota bacterium]|nr:hypothetical protein [Campylobacterota bacterium]MDQ1252763.1 hypothetical protein [Euryarchaeota archaeon]
MIKNYFSLAALMIILLSGCAQKAQVSNMTVHMNDQTKIANADLKESLSVKTVSGGQETSPMWTSEVDDASFKKALEESLKSAGFYSENAASSYYIIVHLLELDQPFAGFDMTVTAKVRYIIFNKKTEEKLFEESLGIPYTATVGDAFLGVKRLQLANEGAIRENIKAFIERLYSLKVDNLSVQ